MLRTFLRACVLLLTAAIVTLSAQTPTVRYIYDELGRLIGVIDQNGDAAVYHYDAVGNLLSITRQGAGTVAIIEFTPNGGPVGATVKLIGTGFSATPSQNAVTFNGTGATVTSSTTTEIVTTVPSGATTGTIAVTTPTGSATSGTSFTVTVSSAPTISSISPTIGVEGTAVTVTGTNFQTTTIHNRLTFNVGQAQVSSATSTSIGTTVSPTSTSGHISVATPYGSAVSSADFFVPPDTYAASDVLVTDRMTAAAAKVVTIGTASKIGLVLFDGIAGQKISLKVSTGVIGVVKIYDHHRTAIASVGVGVAEAFTDAITLSATATYMILVDPNGTNTGSLTLTLYDVVDVTGTIIAGGSSVGVTTTTPGQNGRLTFSGTSGHRVSLKASTGPAGAFRILKPNGTELASGSLSGAFATFIDAQTLPDTGTYTVLVDYSGTLTGTVTLTLYSVPADASAAITAGGSNVTFNLATPGQNGSATFTGTSSHRMAVWITGVTISSVGVSLKDPSGATLASQGVTVLGGFMEPQTLSGSGTHTIFVDPVGTNTGNVTLNLYDTAADVTGSLMVNGGTTGVTTTTPGQNAAYTFAGTASQQITVRVTNSDFNTPTNVGSSVTVKLVRANGTVLTFSTSFGSTFNLATQTLPATETYTVLIDPPSANTGSLTVSVTNP
jgi:YD repeat-containing protein